MELSLKVAVVLNSLDDSSPFPIFPFFSIMFSYIYNNNINKLPIKKTTTSIRKRLLLVVTCYENKKKGERRTMKHPRIILVLKFL